MRPHLSNLAIGILASLIAALLIAIGAALWSGREDRTKSDSPSPSRLTSEAKAPPGFQLYRTAAYIALFPVRWRVTADQAENAGNLRTRFESPGGAVTVMVDWTPGEDTPPPRKARELEAAVEGGSYKRIAFHAFRLGSHAGFEWVFEANGARKADYFLRLPGHGFAILGESEDFSDARSYARAIARSIRLRH